MKELTALSATTLARMIARKKCSAREVLEAHHQRIERFHPQINAIIAMQYEAALAQAEKADQATAEGTSWGPLHGIPMTVKDTFDTIGLRTTIGLPWLRDNQPGQDARLITRLRQAGAIVWGKSSLPFASYDWQCKHPIAGHCHNPWDRTFGPGGSSGGGAAAVASGFSPIELGSDVAGSIRQPAHSCGVYGLRTSEGLLSGVGHGHVPGTPHALRSHVSLGPLSRDPEDLATLLSILIDPHSQVGRHALAMPAGKPLAKARIAWSSTWGGVPLCADTDKTLAAMVSLLQATGAQVEEVPLPFDLDEVYEAYGISHGFEYTGALPKGLGNAMARRLMRHVYYPIRYGRGAFSHYVGKGLTASTREYFVALDTRQRAIQAFEDWFGRWDLWLTPVSATTAIPLQRTGKSLSIEGKSVAYCDVVGMHCCPTAALAHPIISIPSGQSKSGLPIGLQLHGRRWHDRQLVEYAAAIAALMPPLAMPNLKQTCGSSDKAS